MYQYPSAKSKPQEIRFGKNHIIDEYEWMRNASDKDTIAFTNQENVFTDHYFENYKEYYDKYLKEQQELAKNLTYREVVRLSNGMICHGVYNDGISKTLFLNNDYTVKKVITDSGFMEGVHVHGIVPNPINDKLCIIQILRDQAERTSGLVYDLCREKVLTELKDTFSMAWSFDGKYAYYCKACHREDGTIENSLRQYCIVDGKDEVLYIHQGHAAYGNVYPMTVGGVVVNFAVDYHASEMVIYEDEKHITEVAFDGNAREYIGSIGKRHFFKTDEGAALGKIVSLESGKAFSEYENYINETEQNISQAGISNGKIICIYEDAGSQSLCVYDEQKIRHDIKLPAIYGKIDFAVQEFASEKPLFTYESFSIPSCVLELDLVSYMAKLVYESGTACKDVTEELVHYTSRDGVQLAAYIVRKSDVSRNGKNKTLFYGYGGYNATNYVSEHACGMTVANWINEGGIYVHCIIRGGGEYGEEWHRSGWKDHKKNVFNDFCDIVEGVIRDGWTNPKKIAICGLSNGGLLMTALITRRPDLFGCVIASVPQTDLLGFLYDDRGPMYITEYGDPREDKMFEYMKSYSPYHNVREGVLYPGIYIQAGAMDNNVPAYHAKKFAAKMQRLQGERPVLLRVLPYGSHDRGVGEYFHRTIAEMRTFIEIELNLGGKDNG